MVGTEDNNFLPQQKLTKGTAANLIYNLINFLRDTLAKRYLDMSLFSSD